MRSCPPPSPHYSIEIATSKNNARAIELLITGPLCVNVEKASTDALRPLSSRDQLLKLLIQHPKTLVDCTDG